MSDLNRQVAELLGWVYYEEFNDACWCKGGQTIFKPPPYSTDANQIDAAIKEWCGGSLVRQVEFVDQLEELVPIGGPHVGSYELVLATPEQKCKALIAAATSSRGRANR